MPRNWQDEGSDDLSGGITDYPDNAQPNQSAILENFIISRDKGIEVRNGSDVWNLNPLPNDLEALQLFQLEEYIFAYTDDGDVYWTIDDGLSDWTEILTAPDLNEDYGSDYVETDDGTPFYIIPDDAVQANDGWNRMTFRVIVSTVADADPNEIVISSVADPGGSGLDFFTFEFIYHTGSGTTDFIWTDSHTATLEAGLGSNGNLPWTVILGDTILNGTSHADITISGITGVDLTSAGTTNLIYRPIYYFRVKPFIDSTYNGCLSVSKFSGHLYLALYPDDRSWSPNSADLSSNSPDIYEVDNKRIPLRKIYLRYDPDTQVTTPRLTSAQMPPVEIVAEPATGSFGSGGNIYQYEGYARHTYEALVEGEPRQFIVDGPSDRIAVDTQFPIYDASNAIKVGVRILPRAQMAMEILPLDEMFTNFFRSEANLTTLYLLNSIPADYGFKYNQFVVLFSPSVDLDYLGDGDPDAGLFYLVGQTDISPIAAERQDTTLDTAITGNEIAYDSGSDFGYISIPQGPHHFTIANQIGYYADIFKLRNRVYQSIYGIPHATIATAFLDFDDGITGINTFRDKAVVFTRDTTWRMEGLRGLNGQGSITQRLVSDEFGAVSNASIVNTNYGLFFFSRTGLCFTDGFKALRVSEQLFDSYYDWLNDLDYIRGFYHEAEQKVYWSVKIGVQSYWITLHLRFGINPQTAMSTGTGLPWLEIDNVDTVPIVTVQRFDTKVCHVNETDQRILRHQSGMVLVHDPSYTTDYYPPNDERVPITFNWVSLAHHAGTKKYRKWYANVMLVMKQKEQLGITCQPTGYNDLATTKQYLGSCFNYDAMDYGDPLQVWGNPDAYRNAYKIVSFRRMFPEGSIRATYKQVGLETLYVTGPQSSTDGEASFTNSEDAGAYRSFVTIPMSLADAALQCEGVEPNTTGQFAINLPVLRSNRWNVIHKIVDNGTSFDVYIEPDYDDANDYTFNDVDWRLGYIRTVERIGIDNYTMKFTLIGARTHGAYQNSGGASEGDGTEG